MIHVWSKDGKLLIEINGHNSRGATNQLPFSDRAIR
jgi:hypothetical protein